mmetsp:Transcript_9873/g.18666  ORF Transcript_9873/g.18666 Transcript_9873/m.18666 type:complete len:180 (-) Transcript_9873:284-823(-)
MDPYHVLGLPHGASRAAAKDRYLTLAKSCHPDHGGDHHRWLEILNAYETLTNTAPTRDVGGPSPGTDVHEPSHYASSTHKRWSVNDTYKPAQGKYEAYGDYSQRIWEEACERERNKGALRSLFAGASHGGRKATQGRRPYNRMVLNMILGMWVFQFTVYSLHNRSMQRDSIVRRYVNRP